MLECSNPVRPTRTRPRVLDVRRVIWSCTESKVLFHGHQCDVHVSHRCDRSHGVSPSHTFLLQETDIVSHSSTEGETISLDASLPMDGISALDLWDIVNEVFHFLTEPSSTKPKISCRVTGKLVAKHNTQDARSIKRETFWFQCYGICL